MLGSASYNYLAPWQLLFTISLLAGLVAVWASIDRDRTFLRAGAVIASLLIGVMFNYNVTLFIILAMWLWFGYEGRRRQIRFPALALYGLWFVTYGMRGLGADGHLSAYRTLVRMVP